MCRCNVLTVEEMQLLSKSINTTHYLLDALEEQDFESAILELEELNFVVKRLVDMKKKREKQQVIKEIVQELKEKGINIDYAKRCSFLRLSAKNAVEKNQNYTNIHKKRQQA